MINLSFGVRLVHMNIVYFGTDVYLNTFRYLLEHHHVLKLYTYHQTEDYFSDREIVKLAGEKGIPYTYSSITEEEERRFIAEGCGLFLSAEYDRLIPVLPEEEGFRGVNLHCALLPEGRSYCPVECAMARGLKESGVTLHRLEPEFDTGDIILQRRIRIPEEYDSIDLTIECARAADEMIREFVADPDRLWKAAVPQRERRPFWYLPPREERIITHDLTVAEARRRFRIFNRMLRMEIGGEEYNPEFFETGAAVVGPRVILAEDVVIFGLKDGHVRTRLLPADPEGTGRGRG